MKFTFLHSDITTLHVDVIVNASKTTLRSGGGVDGAIHQAAGPDLLEECIGLGGCEVGQAKITKGYKLPAKHVIHAVGPIWHGGDRGERDALRSCYSNSLTLAAEHGLKTIAFPAIATGAYGFPRDQAAKIAYETVSTHPDLHKFEEVIFVFFKKADLDVFSRVNGLSQP